MSYLASLKALERFQSSLLYAHLVGTALGAFSVVGSAMFAFVGWMTAWDPMTESIIMDASWVGSWLFAAGLVICAYTILTLSVMVAALCKYLNSNPDHRLFAMGAYMLLPVFPLGTIYCVYAIQRLNSEIAASQA